MSKNSLHPFNELVFNYCKNLEKWGNLPLPYLTVPSQAYEKAVLKVAVCEPVANYWYKLERSNNHPNFSGNYNETENIYEFSINQDWENLAPGCDFYYALRRLAEGEFPLAEFKDKVGFVHSNIAIITKRNENEYDPDTINFYAKIFEKQIKLLKPNVLLLKLGFGTDGHTESSSLKIIEKTVMGKLIGTVPVHDCSSLFKLEFQNNLGMEIYDCRPCQGFTYEPLVEEFKSILSDILKK